MKCWLCENKAVYSVDLKMESEGWYRFDCLYCGESFYTPKKNPMLRPEDFETKEDK